MNDNILRHLVAILATLVGFLCYIAGYYSGISHWWWTGFGLLVIYGGVYKIIDS